MTTTPTPPRLEIKVRRAVWREEDHPRDREGKFIETGAEVRVWGGWLGRVIRNVGGGRIEVAPNTGGVHQIVHRNYLTVTARPDGAEPTSSRDARPADLPEAAASEDAVEAPTPDAPPVVKPHNGSDLASALSAVDDDETADMVRQAATDYIEALGNGVPDDEADEREGLLELLDDVDARYADNELVSRWSRLVREAAVAEPEAPAAPAAAATPEPERVPVDPDAGDTYSEVIASDNGWEARRSDRTRTYARVYDADGVNVGYLTRTGNSGHWRGRLGRPMDDSGHRWVMSRTGPLGALVMVRNQWEAAAQRAARDTDAKPVYDGGNEEGARDGSNGDTGREPLEGTPADRVRDDQRPDGTLPDDRGRSAGADRRDDGSSRASEPAIGDVPAEGSPARVDEVGGRGDRDAGDRPRDARDTGTGDTGGPGTDRGAEGVPDREGRTGSEDLDPARVTVATVREVYRAPSRDQDDDIEGPGDHVLSAVVGANTVVTFYNDEGVAADIQAGRFVLSDPDNPQDADVEWQPAGGEAHPIDQADIYLIQQVPEPVPAGQGSLFEAEAPSPDVDAVPVPDGDMDRIRDRDEADYRNGREDGIDAAVSIADPRDLSDESDAFRRGFEDGLDEGRRLVQGDVDDTVDPATHFAVHGASVGSWRATLDPTNEGVVTIRGDYGIEGRMVSTIDGWAGSLGQPGDDNPRYTDQDPGRVLAMLYDDVNGEGAAARTLNEVAQGRPAAPEVGREYQDLAEGARIRIAPRTMQHALNPDTGRYGYIATEPGEPVEGTFLSYREAGSYYPGIAGWVNFRRDGVDYDEGESESIVVVEGDRPVPAAPALGEEADLDAFDDDPEYEADPGLVPDRIEGGQAFQPTGLDDFAPAGQMAKLDANLAALRTLRDLRSEDRPATPEEQAVLARWAGWGGLSEVFDPDRPAFTARREELEGLLSPSEWAEARRNTLNAHYTDPRVVQAVWGAVGDLGFNGGRVLEPGSGSGTFIGFAPDSAEMVGVELDSTTAAISKYLYPDAQVWNESFADTNVPDGAFDATVGNVPFGRFALSDPTHNATGQSIHNHFILKSLAFTRPGGLVAVLSSRYTLDSQNDEARRMMYDQADLVGAVRLPNGSHQRVSGTDVIEDVLIFRKRLPGEEPGDDSWLTSTKRDVNGWNVAMNHYFDTHPGHALGEITAAKGQFGGELRVNGDRDMPRLPEVLSDVVSRARENGLTATPSTPDDRPELISRSSGRYDGHIADDGGTFTQAVTGASVPFTVPPKQRDELAALLGIRDTLTALLDAEAASLEPTPEMDTLRADLNSRYDAYVAAYGPINRFRWSKSGSRLRAPQGGFRKDPMAAVVAALETYEPPARDAGPDEVGAATKASIFTTRAVAPREVRTRTDDPADAITLSMDTYGEVNLAAIAKMLDTDEATARERLGALVFEEPPLTDEEWNEVVRADATNTALAIAGFAESDYVPPNVEDREPGKLVPAAEYLSGNVRKKIAVARAAARSDDRFAANVGALRGVIPRDLGPEEIDARLGAAWIDADTVRDFAKDLMGVGSWDDKQVKVAHSGGSIWTVVAPRTGVRSTDQWGTPEKPFPNILQALLEQRSIAVTRDGKQMPDETLAAQEKAEQVQERFAEWVWEDPDRARKLQAAYNDQFNAIALRAYDGSGRRFEGMSEEWTRKVQPHVKNAVERIVNEPTALLAHVVGAGKTAEMVMGTAELKRLGLARKPAIVVPNHMLEQFTREYLEIYPNARIHTAGQGMDAEERRQFVARAATGDWDAVIMTQGAFESIPMSQREQQAYIDREMADLREQFEQAKANAGDDTAAKRTVKKMETALIRAENALKKKLAKTKDVGVSFEQTGIDYLMVDEAHMYSNLRTLSNIQGAGTTGSDKATDLHMKMEYLRENSRSGRVATFATGTPIRNTVTQAYVMQRFLRPDLLREAGVHTFDQWAGTFGSVVDEMELKPEGKGFRRTQRFAKFRNVPEFLRMFHTFADVKLAEDLNLPRPNLAGGQAQTIAVPRTDQLAAYINELGDRADAVRKGEVEPEDDNMLKISTDGRKAALSMALVGGTHEPGKIESSADRIASIYDAHKDKVFYDPKTGEPDGVPGALQIAFMDLGTPKGAKGKDDEASVDDNEADWNGYDALKGELVARGLPAEKIRYIHEAKNDAEKAELFAAARSGRIAVLVGSSEKMGVGTNMQRRAKALHHIDAPWRPADVEQRDGRIHRQGNWHMNMGEDVEIYRYVTEGSFDAYMWQTLERKAKFINQVMKGSLDVREIEDVGDTAMSYAEVKALATGNPDLLEKAKADTQLAKLQRLERTHARAQVNMRGELDRRTRQAAMRETNAAGVMRLLEQRESGSYTAVVPASGPRPGVDSRNVPEGEDGPSRAEVGQVLADRLIEIRDATRWGDGDREPVGVYGGVPIEAQSVRAIAGNRMVEVFAEGSDIAIARLDKPSPLGVVQRLDNFLDDLEGRRDTLLSLAAEDRGEIARINSQQGRDFARLSELDAWRRRAERLAAKMERDERRDNGFDIPFDPAIDSEEYDDPRTRASAETFTPIPEPVPARVEVTASMLDEGARIEFVIGEVSGTMGEGRIVKKRVVNDFVFVTIEGDDGKTYTRAFDTNTPVTKVGDPSSPVGVKGLRRSLTLAVVNGRVVVQTKRRPRWDEALHPRDRNGRFIETFAEVRIWGGGSGRVVSMAGGGRVNVQRNDGTTVVVDAGNITVTKKPDGSDVDVPDTPVSSPSTPQTPEAPPTAAPDTPAAPARAGTRLAPDATPDGAAATFTGPGGARAWLSMEGGQPVGYMQTDPDDPASIVRYADADAWAAAVDEQGWSEDADVGGATAAGEPVAAPEAPGAPGADGVPNAGGEAPEPEADLATPDGDEDGGTAPPVDVATPALDALAANNGNPGRPDGDGTPEDPIDVQGDLNRAVELLADGKHIRLNRVDEVGTLLDRLAELANEARERGADAPAIDMCQVSVPGTNLFCAESQGVPRAEMPQLVGIPTPGSAADGMERNARGRVDLTANFIERLTASGIGVADEDVPAATLKATQSELAGAWVAGIMQDMKAGTFTSAPIFVTRDNYVIDGHHQWAATVGLDAEDNSLGDVTMPVRRIDMEIGEALDYVNAYTAEMGMQQRALGESAGATTRPAGGAGTARVGGNVDALVESMGALILDTDDNTTLPVDLAAAGDEYDAALDSGDLRRKAYAHLALSTHLNEAANLVDTGGEEPERVQALSDLRAAQAALDANVPVIFPPANAGGTPPADDAPVVDDGTVSDLMSSAGREDITNGGSAAAFLVQGSDGQYRFTQERQALHDAIRDSILDGVPVSDDPRYNFFGGGPASGKGSITRINPQLEANAALINADEIKAQIPEMGARLRRRDPAAAGFTHEESSYLAKQVQAEGFRRKVNVTLDGTGDSSEKAVRKKISAARAAGYKIDAYYVSVPVEVALVRAVDRAKNGTGADRGRTVPETVIKHAHAAVSRVFPKVVDDFDSAVLFDTNVPFGTPPNVIGRKNMGEMWEIIAAGKWQEFLDKEHGMPGA